MAKSMWPANFSMYDVKSPKELLDEQAEILSSLTKEIVYGQVTQYKSPIGLLGKNDEKYDFTYKFSIASKYVENYSFTILRLYQPILFYPCAVKVDEGISKEIAIPLGENEIESSTDFEALLGLILQSKKVATVVSALLKLSR